MNETEKILLNFLHTKNAIKSQIDISDESLITAILKQNLLSESELLSFAVELFRKNEIRLQISLALM
ncbi:hypothetical protein LMG8286_00788 [Campylobacter suis]|uniref:Uncharacterized protein n=1 Tax=Campylobacter suis TaxID=2790657 RepID=A0ABM8Q319_9BACT|nr:hypothetical protein LMG8286_00788 [Campylobacter suis]